MGLEVSQGSLKNFKASLEGEKKGFCMPLVQVSNAILGYYI